jgi:hypothetical protein
MENMDQDQKLFQIEPISKSKTGCEQIAPSDMSPSSNRISIGSNKPIPYQVLTKPQIAANLRYIKCDIGGSWLSRMPFPVK